MNGSLSSVSELVEGIVAGDRGKAELAVCPPAIYLMKVGGMLADSGVALGAQNVCDQAAGAYTGEVSAVLKLCHELGQTVVTHGGVTGLAGGARSDSDDIVLSLERMNALGPVDVTNRSVTAEAGVRLQTVQEAAEDVGLLFPLDFGARGSAQIGGAISTNAGGNSVIRYGMAREQVLGLEAVLADGTVVTSMKDVIKNNTGYDLKQLFIGSEGTLGVVTRAVLRLRPLPRSQNTALAALPDFDSVALAYQYAWGGGP